MALLMMFCDMFAHVSVSQVAGMCFGRVSFYTRSCINHQIQYLTGLGVIFFQFIHTFYQNFEPIIIVGYQKCGSPIGYTPTTAWRSANTSF